MKKPPGDAKRIIRPTAKSKADKVMQQIMAPTAPSSKPMFSSLVKKGPR